MTSIYDIHAWLDTARIADKLELYHRLVKDCQVDDNLLDKMYGEDVRPQQPCAVIGPELPDDSVGIDGDIYYPANIAHTLYLPLLEIQLSLSDVPIDDDITTYIASLTEDEQAAIEMLAASDLVQLAANEIEWASACAVETPLCEDDTPLDDMRTKYLDNKLTLEYICDASRYLHGSRRGRL